MQDDRLLGTDTSLEQPFLVYGVDSPTYDERAVDSFGPTPAPPHLFSGSAVVVTGGSLRHGQAGASVEADVYLSDLTMLSEDESDLRFVEETITDLIDENNLVTVVHWKAFSRPTQWATAAHAAGLTTFETLDAVVATGSVASLRRFHWNCEMTSMGITVTASQCGCCPLAKALLDAGRVRSKRVGDIVRSLWTEVQSNPGFLEKALEGCDLYAGTRDPDNGSLVILRKQTDTSSVHYAIRDAGVRNGFTLYNAGSLSEPDQAGHCFVDLEQWNQWRPIPKHWQKVE